MFMIVASSTIISWAIAMTTRISHRILSPATAAWWFAGTLAADMVPPSMWRSFLHLTARYRKWRGDLKFWLAAGRSADEHEREGPARADAAAAPGRRAEPPAHSAGRGGGLRRARI